MTACLTRGEKKKEEKSTKKHKHESETKRKKHFVERRKAATAGERSEQVSNESSYLVERFESCTQ